MPTQGAGAGTSADDKADSAFRTIGEVSRLTGLPAHVLRYWETRFTQLRPVQRAGNRRYYRPQDVALVQRIDDLVNREGYTIAGAQQALADDALPSMMPALHAVRALLADALAEDHRA